VNEIVYIEWDDAYHSVSWGTETDAPEGFCISIGFLIKEDKNWICIAGSFTACGEHDLLAIPKGCVRKIVRVNKSK